MGRELQDILDQSEVKLFPTVSEIPESLDPGQIVFVTETGSLWVGASENTFPTLDEGTPWPLKGYKRALIKMFDSLPSTEVLINEIGDNFSASGWRDEETGVRLTNKNDYDAARTVVNVFGGATDFNFRLYTGGVDLFLYDESGILIQSRSELDTLANFSTNFYVDIKIYPPQP